MEKAYLSGVAWIEQLGDSLYLIMWLIWTKSYKGVIYEYLLL